MKRCAKQQGQVLVILFTTLFFGGGAGTASKAGWSAMGMTVESLNERLEKAVIDPQRTDRIKELAGQWKEKADAFMKDQADRKKELLELITRHDVKLHRRLLATVWGGRYLDTQKLILRQQVSADG